MLIVFGFKLKAKYAGIKKRDEEIAGMGINHVDKILDVKGARISYSIWDVGGRFNLFSITLFYIFIILSNFAYFLSNSLLLCLGDESSHDQIPIASKDSVAMLFMFDLTSRRTLKRYNRDYFIVLCHN